MAICFIFGLFLRSFFILYLFTSFIIIITTEGSLYVLHKHTEAVPSYLFYYYKNNNNDSEHTDVKKIIVIVTHNLSHFICNIPFCLFIYYNNNLYIYTKLCIMIVYKPQLRKYKKKSLYYTWARIFLFFIHSCWYFTCFCSTVVVIIIIIERNLFY